MGVIAYSIPLRRLFPALNLLGISNRDKRRPLYFKYPNSPGLRCLYCKKRFGPWSLSQGAFVMQYMLLALVCGSAPCIASYVLCCLESSIITARWYDVSLDIEASNPLHLPVSANFGCCATGAL